VPRRFEGNDNDGGGGGGGVGSCPADV